MPYKNGNKLCICEICNCGRHRCPHHPTGAGAIKGPCTISEYTNKYVPHPLIPVMSCKPAMVAVAGSGPISDETTTRVDYVAHGLPEKMRSTKPEIEWQMPDTRMEDETAYTAAYTEKRVPRTRPVSMGPRTNRGELGKFVGEPTYRNDYRQWPLDGRSRTAFGAPQPWLPPTQPFEGIPTYTSDYIARQSRPPLSCKPTLQATTGGQPFDGCTDYRASYVKHPAQPREKHHAPQSTTTGSKAPFDGLSVMHRDYTPKEGGRGVSCRPQQIPLSNSAALTSDTTHRVDFRPLPLQARSPVGPQFEYKPPEGSMETDTTYYRDYPKHAWQQMVKSGPQRASRWSSQQLGPFQGTTDYRDSYQKWNVSPVRHRFPAANTMRGDSPPFEGQSTHQAHYIPHPLQPRLAAGPAASAQQLSTGPFDGTTMYRTEYTPKIMEPCPAALLDSPRTQYFYREQDPTGHKFYEPIGSSSRNQTVPVAAS